MDNLGIPVGLAHLDFIERCGLALKMQTFAELKKGPEDCEILGVSLCALYQGATCHRKCHGGNHILEALSARTYNLACSSFHLMSAGFYDEALNLVRSIGEIGNLVMLSVVDKEAMREWVQSDRKARLKSFSPAQVRKKLESSGSAPLLAGHDWYAELCEKYVHPTPEMKPNMHGLGQARAGSAFQPEGLELSLSELTTITTEIAMLICRYFKLDDLYDEIMRLFDQIQTPS